MERGSPQQKQLREALLNAFPTRQDLEMMVSDGLYENLSAIGGEGTLQHTIFKLVQWAVARGKLEQLVIVALKENSHNPQLRSVAESLGLEDQHLLRGFGAYETTESIATSSSVIPKLPVASGSITGQVKENLFRKSSNRSKQPLDDVETDDTFQRYQDGLDCLLERMGKRHPRYAEARTLQMRLTKNIKKEVRQGRSSKSVAERDELLHTLNELADETVNTSFNGFCGLSNTYSDMEREDDELRDWIPYSKFRLITEQRAKEFTGRKFLFGEIKEYLTVPPFSSGYILIEGDAGVGKTAFMAALVRRYGWIHHYVNLQYGTAKPEQFLKSICAQLIIRYNLRSYSDALGDRSRIADALLIDLLFKAVKVADEKRIVILVDALDEAAYKETGNKQRPYEDGPGLFLPPDLPSGVFIIATKRPLHDNDSPNRGALHPKLISFQDSRYQDLNMLDIRNYIESFIEKRASVMQQRIAEWDISRSKFIGDLADKSQGNFMYIVSILGDIFDGKVTQNTIDDIRSLPVGLESYYWFHWRRMQARFPEEFEHLYKPIASFLAASYEPISLQSLAELSGKEPEQVQQVLDDWKQFFKKSVPTAQQYQQYQLYHASFREFLDDVVGLKSYREQILRQRFRDMGGNPDAPR